MKKIEIVMRQLSNLYEFNKQLQTYKLQKSNNSKSQQQGQPDREERGSAMREGHQRWTEENENK